MNINNLGLLNILATIINEEKENSDRAITVYLLENLDNIENVTINEIIDRAFVSHSSVRRFCNRLGYRNFSELKTSFNDIVFPSSLHLRTFESVEDYRENINTQLEKIIKEINKIVDDDAIKHLVSQIHKHNHVIILCSNNTSSDLIKFQQELFYANKIIRVVDSNFNDFYLKKHSKDPALIIVVSISGIFAQEVLHIVDNIKGKKIFVTVNRDKDFSYPYDEIIYLSDRDMKFDKLGLFGKYGISYLFDLIAVHYIYKYKN